MKDQYKNLINGNKEVKVWLSSDIDRIGTIHYKVRVYGDGIISDEFPFLYMNFSQGTRKEDIGNVEKINSMSLKNEKGAQEYFNEKVEHYLARGFTEVPSLKESITNKVTELRNKIFSSSDTGLKNK